MYSHCPSLLRRRCDILVEQWELPGCSTRGWHGKTCMSRLQSREQPPTMLQPWCRHSCRPHIERTPVAYTQVLADCLSTHITQARPTSLARSQSWLHHKTVAVLTGMAGPGC